MALTSFSEAMNAASSGSMFRDFTGQLSGINASAAQLPIGLSAQFTAATANVQSQLIAAQGTFKTASSISQSYAEVLKKKEQSGASTANDTPCGSLEIFTKIKEFLSKIKTSISEGIATLMGPINELKAQFGALYDELQTKIAAVASAVTDAAKAVAQAALDLFKEANKMLADAAKFVDDKIGELTKGLTDGVKAVVDAGKAALKSAISAIKDFAASIKLSLPFNSPCLANAKEIAIDPSKLMANVSLPSLDVVTKQAEGALTSAKAQLQSAIESGSALAVVAAQDAVASATQGIEQAKSLAKSAADMGTKNLPTLMQQPPAPKVAPNAALSAELNSSPSLSELLAKKDAAKKEWEDAMEERAAIASATTGLKDVAKFEAARVKVDQKFEAYKAAGAAATAKMISG